MCAKGAPAAARFVAFFAPPKGNAPEPRARDHGGTGLRPDYSPSYYAAFLLDPDGNHVEAVCTR